MSVYVDHYPARKTKYIRCLFCAHMIADTEDELDKMALRIGLKLKWKQKSRSGIIHYDLSPSMRKKAIQCGAEELTTLEMGGKVRR